MNQYERAPRGLERFLLARVSVAQGPSINKRTKIFSQRNLGSGLPKKTTVFFFTKTQKQAKRANQSKRNHVRDARSRSYGEFYKRVIAHLKRIDLKNWKPEDFDMAEDFLPPAGGFRELTILVHFTKIGL